VACFIIALIAAILVFSWIVLMMAILAADAEEWIRSYEEEEAVDYHDKAQKQTRPPGQTAGLAVRKTIHAGFSGQP